MLAEIDHLKFFGEERVRWKDAAVSWGEAAPASIRPGTMTRYLFSLRAAGPYLDKLYLDEIDGRVIARIAKRAGVSNATRRRDITAVSSVLRHAVAQGWIESNPAALWDRSVIRERRDPIMPPDDADIEKLARHCPATFGDSIRFLRETGMRQGEMLGLEWPSVNLDLAEAQLLRTKTNRPRVVPLNARAVEILARQPRHISRHTVFHADGRPFRNYASRFAGYARTAGVDFRCHDLRHKFAIEWLRAHGDIYRLSRILGHASVKTTEIYLGYVDWAPAQNPAQGRWSDNGSGGCE